MGYIDSTGKHGEIEEKPVEQEEKELKPEQGGESNLTMTDEEVELGELKKYFNIGEMDFTPEIRKQLLFLLGWAAKNGIKTRGDFLSELKKMEFKLGSPSFNESRIGRLYQYLRLKAQSEEINKELSAFEKGG